MEQCHAAVNGGAEAGAATGFLGGVDGGVDGGVEVLIHDFNGCLSTTGNKPDAKKFTAVNQRGESCFFLRTQTQTNQQIKHRISIQYVVCAIHVCVL